MGDVLTITLRARPVADRLAPTDQLDVCASLEEAVQATLDTADQLMAVLNGMEGKEGRPMPSVVPELHAASAPRVRVADNDREAETPAVLIPDVQIEIGAPLPWSGRGNVFTAIGGAVLELTTFLRQPPHAVQSTRTGTTKAMWFCEHTYSDTFAVRRGGKLFPAASYPADGI